MFTQVLESGIFIHCLRMRKKTMILWGVVYHRLRNVNLYRTAPKHGRLKLGLFNSEDFDKTLKFCLCCSGKGYFTLKAE